jgi:arsenate reductase
LGSLIRHFDGTALVRCTRLKSVLFICTHNSARSQMAEAFLNKFCGDKYEAKSAGITPTGLNPHVVRVMAEIGIDLSTHRSKSILEFQGKTFDYVVTVCDAAREACPFFPGEKEIHKNFPDPSTFKGSKEEILRKVRVVRDEIKEWVERTFCKENVLAERGEFV